MNYGPFLFLGAFLTFAFAWVGLVFAPNQQLKDLQPTQVVGTSVTNPRPYSGVESDGREVYKTEGCVYCHSQQVRGGQYNNDVERGWGMRRSHPQDYLFDRPLLLGTSRTGPDLVNIGARQPSADWHLKHLYDPQLISPGSIMAPFRHLFEYRKIVGQPSSEALKFNYAYVTLADDSPQTLDALKAAGFNLVEKRGRRYIGGLDPKQRSALGQVPGVRQIDPYVPEGWEIVPTHQAKALVAYLKSLDHSYAIELPPGGGSVP